MLKKISLTLVTLSLQAARGSSFRSLATCRVPVLVVDAMLETAKVAPSDIVYDLGSGDGRIVITAAKKFGARGRKPAHALLARRARIID